MQTLPRAVISKSWLNKLPLVLQLSNGSGNLFLHWPATLHLIYKALIQPYFDYCNLFGRSCGIKLAHKLQILQNRAARALSFSSYDADASQLFENLNGKNLSTQCDIQKALMVYKSINGLASEYLSTKFIAQSNTTSYTFVPWLQRPVLKVLNMK